MVKNSKTNSSFEALSQKKMVISRKKQRIIPLSTLSLTGSISSIKNNDFVQFESSLERDYIYLIEFDNRVFRYYEQPFKLFYYQNNTYKYYVPDFFVEYWDGLRILIEIKYYDDLIKNRKEYQKKFNVAEEFCNNNNIIFKVLTENEIRVPQLFNAKFLLSYKNPKYGFNLEHTQIIFNTLNKYEKLSVQQLLDISVKNESFKAELLYVLWYMVSNYLVYFDDNQKLNMETQIWLPKI